MATHAASHYYIYVVQDGVVRLTNSSPEQIMGVTTDGVETCVVYIFIGINGNISFLHASTTISMSSIEKELDWVEQLKTWYIVANYHEQHNKDRFELEKLQEIKKCVDQRQKILPKELYNTEKYSIAVTYRRHGNDVPLVDDKFPNEFPVIMPPFADKLLAVSFLNGLVSALDTVDLLIQFDVDRWTFDNKMTPNAKQVFNSDFDISKTLQKLDLPPTIELNRLLAVQNTLKEEITRLKMSSKISWIDIMNGYIWDDPILESLRKITGGYPFIGIKSSNLNVTAWLFINDNDRPAQRCEQIIKVALKNKLPCTFDEVENPRNSMSKNILGIRITDLQKDETAEKLRKS
jgi:hypothetical protein